MRQNIIRSSVGTKDVFFTQCIDHLVGVSVGVLFLWCGLSLSGLPLSSLAGAGWTFWFGAILTLVLADFAGRVISLLLLGATTGSLIMGLRLEPRMHEPLFWVGQALESTHVAFPALWALEILSRLTHSRFPRLRYKFAVTA